MRPLLIILTLHLLTSVRAWAEEKREFAYINGGCSPSSNYASFEHELLAFQKGVFADGARGRVSILNGGGKDTKLVLVDENGNYIRDKFGYVQLTNTVLDEAFPSATLSNTVEMHKSISSRKPDSVSVVYSDHGYIGGVALWTCDTGVTNSSLKNFSDIYSPETIIRSIHVHCYSGSLLADSSRIVPGEQNQFLTFVQENYPKNRCGFALAKEDEMSYDFSNFAPESKDWTKSYWGSILQKEARPSIQNLWDHFSHTKEYPPTPMRTSDYFLADFQQFLCKSRKAGLMQECQIQEPQASAIDSIEEVLQKILGPSDLCDNNIDKKNLTLLNQNIAKLDSLFNLANKDIAQLTLAYIKKYHKKFLSNYERTIKEREDLQKEYYEEGLSAEKLKKLEERSLILQKEMSEFYRVKASFGDGKHENFNNFLASNEAKKIMLTLKEKSPSLYESTYFIEADGNISVALEKISTELVALQSKRKNLAVSQWEHTRGLLEKELSKTAYAPLKSHYENIQSCEKSPIN